MQIPPFKLERYFAQHEFEAPFLLCSSDCESLALQDLLKLEPAAHEKLEKTWLGYTESAGHPELRAAIAGTYQGLESGNILVHAGAEEAIFGLINTLLRPGDHAIVHWPCYQSLFQIAESIGCEVTRWEADPETKWALDVGFLKDQIRPNTKLVVLNTPHNPTGYLMSHSDFAEVIRTVDGHGAILLSDEVYRGLEYNTADRLPAACELSPRCVSLGVMSKSYGLAGLRIGWVATQNLEILKSMAAFKDYTSMCNSAPSETLATLALAHVDKLLARNRGLISENLLLVDKFMQKHHASIEWARPKAGCIAFPKLVKESAESFSARALKSAGVLIAPSSLWSYGDQHFRIGFGRSTCKEALSALEKVISA